MNLFCADTQFVEYVGEGKEDTAMVGQSPKPRQLTARYGSRIFARPLGGIA